MKWVILLLCLAAVGMQARIIGGRDCKPNEALYHVVLKDYKHNGLQTYGFCGGSIINKYWVITAAHCHKHGNTLNVEIDGKEIEIKKIRQYPSAHNDLPHDIMLLKLPTPTKISPIHLPTLENCRPPKQGKRVMMVGKSATTYNKKTMIKNCELVKHVQCATTTVVDCKDHLNKTDAFLYPALTCTSEKGVDACRGDSGGALVYSGELYGVLVMASKKLNSFPVASVDICYYRKWIHKNTGV